MTPYGVVLTVFAAALWGMLLGVPAGLLVRRWDRRRPRSRHRA